MLRVDGGLVATSQYGLPPFRVARPRDLDGALEALEAADSAPTVLAGGTDLVAQLREGLKPRDVVDISALDDLARITATQDTLSIGPLVTHATGARHETVARAIPGFAPAWGRLANVRVRGRASLGGNLMARRPRYEGSILMSALDAGLRFAAPNGEVVLSPEDIWHLDDATSAVPERALLTAIDIPLERRPRLAYDRSLRPTMTLATALWQADEGGLTGRAVIATEWLRPAVLPLAGGPAGREVLAREADARAAATLDALPESFRDGVSGHGWLKRAGAALLARHLADPNRI